jgi:ATP adenylyltransferase
MERLWSPWRLSYVSSTNTPSSGCIFCDAAPPPADPAEPSLVLVRGRLAYVVLNLYPYNNGHLMVAPVRHINTIGATTGAELAEIMAFVRDAEQALTEAYRPEGINVGINLGRPAGAGVPGHLHVHLVPRWNGDTNFMSVVGGTRVLPEDLGSTGARLRPIFERLLYDRA